MCSAFAALGMGAVAFEDGYRAAGEWDNMARNYWWAADYLMRCGREGGREGDKRISPCLERMAPLDEDATTPLPCVLCRPTPAPGRAGP